ncbi:unnamed protein product [Ixodes pacificus]
MNMRTFQTTRYVKAQCGYVCLHLCRLKTVYKRNAHDVFVSYLSNE